MRGGPAASTGGGIDRRVIVTATLLVVSVPGFIAALVADRWPQGRGIVAGRSRCDARGRTLAARDLAPLLPFLSLRGRARRCGAPIPRHLPVVEAAVLLMPLTAAAAGAPLAVNCGGCRSRFKRSTGAR